MKKIKINTKKLTFVTILSLVVILGANQISVYLINKSSELGKYLGRNGNLYSYITYGMEMAENNVSLNHVEAKEKEYGYNERVPVEVIKAEIIKQAKLYGNDIQFMLDLAECESTFNNLADNPTSTAKGVYQFVALTWEATESNKNKISEFDYKANIKEANIKIANEEYSHWKECLR